MKFLYAIIIALVILVIVVPMIWYWFNDDISDLIAFISKKYNNFILRREVKRHEKVERKKYKKMNRKYMKILKHDYKVTKPYDYGFGLQFFVDFLYYMRDYYRLGYNVWTHPSEVKNTLGTIENAIDEYEAWQGTEDKYYIIHETGGKENKKGIKFGDEYTDWWCEDLLPDPKENMKACSEEYMKHRNNFFTIVSDNIERWWD